MKKSLHTQLNVNAPRRHIICELFVVVALTQYWSECRDSFGELKAHDAVSIHLAQVDPNKIHRQFVICAYLMSMPVPSSHCHTIAWFHRHTVTSSRGFVVTPSHHRVVSSSHRRTVASSHHRVILSSHPHTIAWFHRHTVTPSRDFVVAPSHHRVISLAHRHVTT